MQRPQHPASSPSWIDRAPILGIIVDLPNAVTLVGASLSMLALALAVSGAHAAALALVLWSHFADSLDGHLARRMKARPVSMGEIGKCMDTLADFLSSGAFPLVLLISVGDVSLPSVATGMLVCAAGLLRLSYFEARGLDQGRFIGLPLPHNIPVFAFVYLVARESFPEVLLMVLQITAVAMAALHLSPLRVPKLSPPAIAASAIVFALMTCLLLL